MKKSILMVIFCILLTSCQEQQAVVIDGVKPILIVTTPMPGQTIYPNLSDQPIVAPPSRTMVPSPTSPLASNSIASPSPIAGNGVTGNIPKFDHVILMILENEDYGEVIGNPLMPNLNALAKRNVLLSNYFAVSHPSLPNYISIMSGDTQKITSDCSKCFVNAPNIADLIESSGRTWKSYEEDMPSACFIGDSNLYAQKHNPMLYFNSIRLNETRCKNDIVPLTQLDTDLAANKLPNFSFIMPNLCNSGHDCKPDVSDTWIGNMVNKLTASPALGKNSMIMIVYDEGAKDNRTACCDLGSKGGGQVAAVLISPLAKPGFVDNTAYDHYSILKTILNAWNLSLLGKTQNQATSPILAPWQP